MQLSLVWKSLIDLVLSQDHVRRARVAMALLGLVLMVASSVVMLFLADTGVIGAVHAVKWWAALSVGGLAMMVLVIRCGWSERWSEPALTIPQMAWTIASGAVAYVLAGEAKGVVPSVLAMILFFGAFGLNLLQVLGIGLYAMAAFAVAVLVSPHFHGGSYEPMDVAYGLMILIVLSGSMALNVRIQRTRQNLYRKRRDLALALAENRELALRDDLTGLLNRRAMLEIIHMEHRRSQRQQVHMVLAMLDLDHFKPINDVHGHAMGDLALQAFANKALASVRESDVLARWGGDEFLLLLSGSNLHDAKATLDRLREKVVDLEVADLPGPLGLSLSAGLAAPLPGETIADTLNRADQALYAAKAQGRNRVAVADDVMPAAP